LTLFWIIAIGMTALALAFVLTPLLRRRGPATPDPEAAELAVYRQRLSELKDDLSRGVLTEPQFNAAKEELETALASDLRPAPSLAPAQRHWPTALIVLILVPLLAFVLYQHLGAVQEVGEQAIAEQAAESRAQDTDKLLKQLEDKLAQDPKNGEGWALLGRSYLKLGDAANAAEALGKAHALLGDDPDLLLDYAQALAFTQGESLQGAPAKFVELAVAKAPEHPRALWLAAMLALDEGARDKARQYLERLAVKLEPGSEDEQLVRAQLEELKGSAASASAPKTQIEVQVSLAPELQTKVKPTDTVFVFARAAEGPRMPLAVVRREARDLPFTVTLDDSLAMTPEMRLSKFPKVVIGARVSRAGDPMPKAGDIEGLISSPVDTTASPKEPMEVVLGRLVP
jgi:cytochrome c-type biogenesis protein CcmH